MVNLQQKTPIKQQNGELKINKTTIKQQNGEPTIENINKTTE